MVNASLLVTAKPALNPKKSGNVIPLLFRYVEMSLLLDAGSINRSASPNEASDGVTDGVGGWARKLVDAGKFTKEYVTHIANLYDTGDFTDLKSLLDNASKMTKASGSSTCVMAQLKDESPNELFTCNLGDSAYLLLRPSRSEDVVQFETLFRSATQQSRFNAPFQTGTGKRWPTKAFSTSHPI